MWKLTIGIILVVVSIIFAMATSVWADPFSKQGGPLLEPGGWTASTTFHVHGEGQLTPLSSTPVGVSPTQIRTAYNLPSSGGSGTIAVIEAYDDPTILNDLKTFSSQYGLPAPSNADFEEHMMATRIPGNSGWALEISLDVEWAHAIAPQAKVLLVEAPSSSLSDLLTAVDYARNRSDVTAVSMSWEGSEFSSESSYDTHFTSNHGTEFFASSGDSGAGANWPASSPNVIGVGGTTLNFSGNIVSSETAWSESGGGVSAYELEPTFQSTYGISGTNGKRCVPDVSFDADPNSGVSVYDSTPYERSTGWFQVGGTSVGAPQWAAIASMGSSASNNNFYSDGKLSNYSSYFRDIVSGSNGYPAKIGYDMVTGLGSPLTINFTPLNVPNFSISASKVTQTITPGGSTTYPIFINPSGGFTGQVNLGVSGLPFGATPSFSINPATTSSVLQITATTAVISGSYILTISGISGLLTSTTQVTLVIGNANYAIASSPSSAKAHGWSSTFYTVTVLPVGGFSGMVSFSLSGLPPNTNYVFNPNPTANTSTLTIFTSPTTPLGTYSFTITGTSGSLVQTAIATLIVSRY